MSANRAISERFQAMARLFDVLGEDSFRCIAHVRAARAIDDQTDDVTAMSAEQLQTIKGIGPRMAAKVREFADTGRIAELDEAAAKVPAGVMALLEVPGLGPKTVRTLWQEGGVTDVAGLERAIADGSILKLARMSAKTVESLKAALTLGKSAGARLWLGRAWPLAQLFIERLREHPAVERLSEAGSLRRGRDTIGDIDILVALKPGREAEAADIGELFRSTPGVVGVLAAGDTKSSVRVSLSQDLGRWKPKDDAEAAADGPAIQVDLRVVPLASWGAALLYFTGSKAHNIRLRERALERGLTLNEYGLGTSAVPAEPEEDGTKRRKKRSPVTRAESATTDTRLGGDRRGTQETEEGIYAALGLPYIPPEVREDQREFDQPGPWRLVEFEDIKAELHAHTTASDGSFSIDELAAEAKRRGFHTIAVTDHSQSSTIARGLKPDRLRLHINEVRAANERAKGITILAGSEVDILADGRLDYDDELLAQLDIVIASPHAALSQDTPEATARAIKAASHPLVHILGHPTGRLINRRRGLEPDLAELFGACKEHGTALEINSHWMRLDLRDTHAHEAFRAGCLLSINCDTHVKSDMDNLPFGVMTARRAWVTPAACINTWPAKKLHAWLKAKGR